MTHDPATPSLDLPARLRATPNGGALALELRRTGGTFHAALAWAREEEIDRDRALAFLHANERAYHDGLPAERRRRSFLLGRLAAKRAIALCPGGVKAAEVDIVSGIFSQPLVRGIVPAPVGVSITHAGEIGCAVAFPEEHPMAVDLEQIDPQNVETMTGQLTADERRSSAALALSEPARCAALWSAREALSKVLKCGMTCAAHVLETAELVALADGVAGTYRHFGQYRFRCWIWDDTVLALTLPKNSALVGDPAAPHGDVAQRAP